MYFVAFCLAVLITSGSSRHFKKGGVKNLAEDIDQYVEDQVNRREAKLQRKFAGLEDQSEDEDVAELKKSLSRHFKEEDLEDLMKDDYVEDEVDKREAKLQREFENTLEESKDAKDDVEEKNLLLDRSEDQDDEEEKYLVPILARSEDEDAELRKSDSRSDCKKNLNPNPKDCHLYNVYRSLDGSCNNVAHPTWGAANTPLRRRFKSYYKDNLGAPHESVDGLPLPTPQEVSDVIFKMLKKETSKKSTLSELHMSFGQFLDHDLSLSPNSEQCHDCNNQAYPCYPMRTKRGSTACTPFTRSFPSCGTAKREQVNILSSYLDASQVYSVKKEKLKRMRKNDGTGQMKMQSNGLLPIDDKNHHQPCSHRGGCFLAGDPRANVHLALVGFHTLFVREHNRIATKLKNINSHWNGEKIFQETRKIVIAILQHITYREYVPTIAGAIGAYQHYQKDEEMAISNVFSTAAFRYGHSQISNAWAQLDKNFNKIRPDISLQSTFFNNKNFFDHGIESIFLGLVANRSAHVDLDFAYGVGEKLFVPPDKSGHLNLAALNIQRGRDHGLPPYNVAKLFNQGKGTDFSKLEWAMDKDVVSKLKSLYRHVDNIDLFVGGLAEHGFGAFQQTGPTFLLIFRNVFNRIRHSDRFFYKRYNVFKSNQLKEIEKVSMAKVLCDNLKGVVSMQLKAFRHVEDGEKRKECTSIPGIDLNAWKEQIWGG